MNPEELLLHADFVRLLARRLVLDENRAADIAQETWIAALEHPPTSEKPLRAWLSKVAGNFARKLHRGESRRRTRELLSSSTGPAAAPSAADIAVREEMRRRVVEAVDALDEPWRSTILLRYYENLPHKQVAARLGVPLETMRTRLKKGLALLRSRFDAEHCGDRNAWRLAIAPIAGIEFASASTGVSTGTTAGIIGAFGMSTKVIALSTATLVLGSLMVVWLLLFENPQIETPRAGSEANAAPMMEGNTRLGQLESATFVDEESSDIAANETERLLPAPTEVVWRGRVIEYDGLPREGVAIQIDLVKSFIGSFQSGVSRIVVSGAGGSFESNGLIPGEYYIHISCDSDDDMRNWSKWGTVIFKEPGVMARDLLLSDGEGAIVAGVVVDETTGRPLRRPAKRPRNVIDFYVGLHNADHDAQSIAGEVDHANGTFCIRNVPSMQFDLILVGPGLCMKVLPAAVDTRETKIIDDLRLAAPSLGNARIKFSGFPEKEIRSIEVQFEHESGGIFNGPLGYKFDVVKEIEVPVGKGRVTFRHPTLGSCVRSFEIRRGEVFDITVGPGDFESDEPSPVKVVATLKASDGTPVAGASIGFRKTIKYIPSLKQQASDGVTDAIGRLEIGEIEPGIWSAWCTRFDTGKLARIQASRNFFELDEPMHIITFHGIVIPGPLEEDCTIDLVIPGGVIKGTLCDKWTGLPLGDDGICWRWVMVNSPDESFRNNGIAQIRTQNSFELSGIRAGRYQLGVAVFGYEHHLSDAFTFEEGQVLDMGRIYLEPVGTMEIEVQDPDGNPLRSWVSWKGKKDSSSIYGLDRLPLSAGKMVYGNLPFGSLNVTVRAGALGSKEITLDITPGRRARAFLVFGS